MSPATSPDALDGLAARLLSEAAALRIEPARTPEELHAVHRLRYEHVVEHGWASAADLPAGLERDGHDDTAVQIAAWDGDALAGTLRMVPPVPGRRLPVEEAFDLDVEPRGAVVDVGRLVIAAPYRGDPAHRIWGALFARCWVETRALGFAVLAGVASAALVGRYRAMGLAFEILGPAKPYWGEDRHPVRLDPARGGRPDWRPTRRPSPAAS